MIIQLLSTLKNNVRKEGFSEAGENWHQLFRDSKPKMHDEAKIETLESLKSSIISSKAAAILTQDVGCPIEKYD